MALVDISTTYPDERLDHSCSQANGELGSYLDEEYNTTDSKKSPNMCIVTLSVLDKCRHEPATIDYCKKADKKANETNLDSGEATTPRETCTESLGWLIYKSLTAPVTCKSCQKWLAKKNKRTYSGVFKESSEATGDEKKSNSLTTSARPQEKPSEAVYTGNGARGPTQLGSPAARSVGDPYD
ncbi:hypothetical protein Q7P36_011217 [Cladosporium allicinum]